MSSTMQDQCDYIFNKQIEKTTLNLQLYKLNKLNELANRQSRAQNKIFYNLPENLNNAQKPISETYIQRNEGRL
ncbi:Uncharacterized protein FWK35_00013046 [Aphis craccivora]|uniref:Uncharacterized protein n=1 Tax=Aphis craccivora TaxID=307492 RepID=A0A6G0YIB5_APHCR|nr:Uncharacterized protein FWK35_00013046 [Aphis craccivora]